MTEQEALDPIVLKVGQGKAFKNKWIRNNGDKIIRQVARRIEML